MLGSSLGLGNPAAQVEPMPIYEYECRECQHRFELLVFESTSLACPDCESTDLERLMSLSAVSCDSTRKRNLGLARKGAKKVQDEKAHAEHEAIHHHHH
jgi:putative FmdB family regulatory protein